jgi:DNA invertase Pin-like site-specific DNA recombinase
MVTTAKGTRTFQKRQEPDPQDMWYSPIPLDVMWGIYARQSTQAQLMKNAESTEMQTDDLTAWLIERGIQDGSWKLFDADLGVSGTLRIDERTGLQELVELIKADIIKAVLVYQISRLFRDDTGVQYNTFAKICKEHNCVLVTADGMVFNFNNRMHVKMFRFLAEYAAEYIPQQIGLLHAARLRKARKGLYAGLGIVPTGYLVDYRKNSKTYERLVPYWPHGEKVVEYLERFYELEADMGLLCRELDELPYLFPRFGLEVDPRVSNNKRWKSREVPGGYTITRKGLELLLCNPVLIGWWIVEGDVISTKNHDPIVPPDKQYLFWYAFEHLSPYNTDGTVNEQRTRPPRRFYQKGTEEKPGLLKNRITAPGCQVHVHVYDSNAHYSLVPENAGVGLMIRGLSDVNASIVDNAFTDRFFDRLQETHDFDEYRRYLAEIVQKHLRVTESITTQLAEIDRQQEALLDEKLAVRSHINERIREAVTTNPGSNLEELRVQFEKEAQPDLERLERRVTKLKNLERELRAKFPDEEEEKEIQTARKYQDFQTEIAKLLPVWHKKPIQVRREFVNLFVSRATLEVVSSHWVRLTIQWKHPTWETDVLLIYRQHGPKTYWTDEERGVLYQHYPTASRAKILALLPLKSWGSIMHEAKKQGITRTVATTCILPEQITWSDWLVMQEKGIAPNDRSTKCSTLSAHSQ